MANDGLARANGYVCVQFTLLFFEGVDEEHAMAMAMAEELRKTWSSALKAKGLPIDTISEKERLRLMFFPSRWFFGDVYF